MHMFFSALVTGTSPPPPQTTNNVGRVHAEFRGSTLYNVGVGGGGGGRLQGIVQKLALFYESPKKVR